MQEIRSNVEKFVKNKRRRKAWMRVVISLACVVVFCTVYALILPAVTLERTVYCGQQEHQHSEDCYTEQLICGLEESGHIHTEDCYDSAGTLVCGWEETGTHVHTEACYEAILSCGQEEHTHNQSCYVESDGETGSDAESDDGSGLGGDTEENISQNTETDDAARNIRSYQGEDYTVTVSYGVDAQIPEDAELIVSEYAKDSDTYQDRYEEAAELYGWTEDKQDSVRLFNVGFYADDVEVEPAAPVSVSITYTEQAESKNYLVTHFGEEGTEDVTATSSYANGEQTLDFALDSFSDIMLTAIDTVNLDGRTFALVHKSRGMAMMATSETTGKLDGQALAGTFSENSDGFYSVTAIGNAEMVDAVIWKFESATNGYYITTTVNGQTEYLRIDGNYITLETQRNRASVITVTNGTGDYVGMVRLTNSTGQAINLYSGQTIFGGWNDGKSNEYFYLVSQITMRDISSVNTVQGVSPNGTVINLFDYWAIYNGKTVQNGTVYGDYGEGDNLNEGINADHDLKFTRYGSRDESNTGGREINVYKSQIRKDIVKNTLENGYPVLNDGNYGVTEESLAYLFDPDVEQDYRHTYRNVSGLLQTDPQGYYYYDSQKNYAELNKDDKTFTLYDSWGVLAGGSGINGQFFPFNSFSEAALETPLTNNLNHYFGMTLTSRFIQRYDGYTNSSRTTPMEFEFSGDDDVWIFIDGVLVADLGGIRDAQSVSIDFVTGKVSINGEESTTLYKAFQAAGKENSVEWSTDTDGNGHSDTFANNTYHTLKFFYLERGNSDSNLSLKYNLSSYPPTGIYKVNQYGDAVSGADFAVYQANADYTIINETPVYTGTTDGNGQMVFVDKDNMPYTLSELKGLFGEYFVLKETTVPKGYRKVGDQINLHIDGKVMVCENTPSSGVWTSPNLQVSAPNTIYLNTPYNGSNIVEVVQTDAAGKQYENGKIFAVVLKYIGPDVGNSSEENRVKQANWAPVYGNETDGFMVVEVPGTSGPNTDRTAFIQAAIDTAKRYTESDNVFSLAASGALQGGLDGMPGDIQNYYYMASDKSKTEYTIAYYWTTANSLEGATAGNTYRIDADGTPGEAYAFERVFGATIQVPNLLNRMLVQKTDDNGTLVNDAVFAMYRVEEEGGNIYYVADDGTWIDLGTDEDGDNAGTATLKDGTTGTYTVATESTDQGVITVKIGDASYSISPATNAQDTALCEITKQQETDTTTGDTTVGNTTTDSTSDYVGEDGTADFSYLLAGKYYIREISAPDGYLLNPTETMALVTDNSIYVNAGTANDGVTVGRGPGYLASNMRKYASEGDVDRTLSWIYTQLRISEESHSFSDVNASDYTNKWKYITKIPAADFENDTTDSSNPLTTFWKYDPKGAGSLFNYALDKNTAKDSVSTNVSDSRRLYTDIGWSYLEIYQNYAYGNENHGSANYESWTGNISHLFSRSVYVRVADETDNSLTIKKVDTANQNGAGLPGAEFTLSRTITEGEDAVPYYYSYDVASDTVEWVTDADSKSVLKTDKDGLIALPSGLSNGVYSLVETKSPDGYKLLTKPVTFRVENGVITLTAEDWAELTQDATDDSNYILTVSNSAGISLPNTGGPGRTLYTMAGLLLMISAAGLMYKNKMRRKEAYK